MLEAGKGHCSGALSGGGCEKGGGDEGEEGAQYTCRVVGYGFNNRNPQAANNRTELVYTA